MANEKIPVNTMSSNGSEMATSSNVDPAASLIRRCGSRDIPETRFLLSDIFSPNLVYGARARRAGVSRQRPEVAYGTHRQPGTTKLFN
jgi:hypothetical protein